ncbi:hypothetical protein BDC45DRAFT_525568 [Circinella umbellata]|nr:hypothetical protein BDC45DRAFT_525568 [Circinella umbellata]
MTFVISSLFLSGSLSSSLFFFTKSKYFLKYFVEYIVTLPHTINLVVSQEKCIIGFTQQKMVSIIIIYLVELDNFVNTL